ncbi:major flagellin subunit FlaA_2 [Nautilia profundicola AmH]|uniref:Flagellin n=1 Tax=Nautilia profundicola (strain ATCC BAA-1463 / DSM 18972 / AmH) TaxID=598659 RepID=B9L6L0_NAUPA|nr:flagellin A [Nautilia profundicola]ACM93555.1 major flagellin subunit FlaA_2 [Nautilia profundicola AmH]
MGFRINTNVAALNAHAAGVANNRNLSSSLEKLSTGLRINKAADDASGLQIADALRDQADSLGQAIRNANDAIGLFQIADKAMDEQVKILNTIKVKATQAAQDGQSADSRKALQEDIVRLMEELDNIAGTTSYNGMTLLSGQFTNKEFQIGAYSNETVKASIGPTSSDKIGLTRFETGAKITAAANVNLTFKAVDGIHDVNIESVIVSTSAGTGIGVLAEVINKNSDKIGVKATWQVLTTGSAAVAGGDIKGLTINGVTIGDIIDVKANDSDGKLVAAINAVKDQTGVEAYVDERGNLNLRSLDGRGIKISGTGINSIAGLRSNKIENYGRLTLTRLDARDIIISGTASLAGFNGNEAQTTINLRSIKGNFTADQASAIGAFANSNVPYFGDKIGAGVTSLRGAMAVMDIADAAAHYLDKIRADIGSVQNQLVSTINNISVTQVNVKAAESQIRDVDFAEETANFQKYNVLAQSGSYALSQANAVQQNVLKLLQ